MFIITSNPETFTYGIKDEEINEMLLDDNSTLIPDGIAIVKASKKLGFDVKERITGIDLSEELLKICDKNKYNLALLGASREVIDKLVEIIHVKYPNIKNKNRNWKTILIETITNIVYIILKNN